MSDRGRSLELYFVNGSPDGLVTAEMFNWTGHVLMVPRTRLAEAIRRREAAYTGVYLLMGQKEGRTRLYIGETEKLSARLKQHAAEKDWWDRAALVTARDDGLNKAHARYLEARLCELASTLGLSLENGNTPGGAGLSEAQTANMEGFLDELRFVLPSLGIIAFENKGRDSVSEVSEPRYSEDETSFVLESGRRGLQARAKLVSGEFVVTEGSQASIRWTSAHTGGYSQLHDELLLAGELKASNDGSTNVFSRNYAFSSPSGAASVILGRPASGPLEWKVEGTNQTYKDWEAARLEAATAEAAA